MIKKSLVAGIMAVLFGLLFDMTTGEVLILYFVLRMSFDNGGWYKKGPKN